MGSCGGDSSYATSPTGAHVAANTLRNVGQSIPSWMEGDAASLANAGLPVEWIPFALAWEEYESGGRIGSLGLPSLDERGLFQISAEEAQRRLGMSIDDHHATSRDRETSIAAGVALIDSYANTLTSDSRYDVPTNGTAFAPLVKLMHGGGPGYTLDLLKIARAALIEPQSWADLRDFWKSEADDRNVVGRRCLIYVDATDAILYRASELWPTVRSWFPNVDVAAADESRPGRSVAKGGTWAGVTVAGFLVTTATLKVFTAKAAVSGASWAARQAWRRART